MANVILGLIFLVLVVAITLIFVGIRDSSREGDPLQERLADFASRGDIASLEEIELSQSLNERVILPMARKLGEFALRFTPQNALHNTTRKLELAGNPTGLEPTTFWASRFLLAFIFGAGLLVVFSVSTIDWTWGRKLIITFIFILLGFFMPELMLQSKIQKRQLAIRRAMPDALDLLTICVQAGLGFDAAMSKVNEKWDNELSLSFGRVLREIQLGKLRREALKDMADRVGISEMTSFVAAIVQSEQLGVSMSKVLRIQADQMRMKRRQMAEEAAHKAPIKMLFPMGLLIFPSLLIILLGPAALLLSQSALAAYF